MERDLGGSSGRAGGGSRGEQAAHRAKAQGQELGNQARQQADKLSAWGGEQVRVRLGNQKHQASQMIAPVQTALRETAHQLRKQGQNSAQYVERATDQVERFSDYLRETDVDDLVDGVRGVARRRPALFLGGAATLGFLATRFLKSSSQEQQDSVGERYETSGGTGASHGTREPAATLPPGGFEGEYPTYGRPLSEGERTEPREGPSMSPRGY
ncbi:MAG: hypothetical protein M3P49_10465 [Actinomycetota bacterium]|nr:hypothetical protein [Actinomycetota bacterium]